MDTNSTPDEQNIETTLGYLSKADLLSLIKRMVQLYPDLAGLIEMVELHRNLPALKDELAKAKL